MKNLVIAIIVILLIIVGVVYFVGRDSDDMIEEVDMMDQGFDEGSFFTPEEDPFMMDGGMTGEVEVDLNMDVEDVME